MTATHTMSYTLRGLLHTAGIFGDVVEIPNQYWPEGERYDDIRTPWLRVFTQRGVIVIGWRKRVIEIAWSDSTITKHGKDVVVDPSHTHESHMCHAWSYADAVACLRRLWSST